MKRKFILFILFFAFIFSPMAERDLYPQPIDVPWTPELVHQALKSKNSQYNGKAIFKISEGQVMALQLTETNISDLSPLKGMQIQELDLRGLSVSDLSALKDLPLRTVYLEDTNVENLYPLKGMQLVLLYLNNTKVRDLSPLAGMPLESLNLFGTLVVDLNPLQGMPLQYLWLNETPVSDISSLSDCPLISITLHQTQVEDLNPLSSMTTLQRLHIGETPVDDLWPINGLKLRRLIFTPGRIKNGVEIVKEMQSLSEIGTTFENRMSPQIFWKLYETGKLK